MRSVAFPIVSVRSFIEATRDTGYKSTASAIAELVDNAFEAEATNVDIRIEEMESPTGKEVVVRVADNGTGMKLDVLRLALQFGGSTRFGSRKAAGPERGPCATRIFSARVGPSTSSMASARIPPDSSRP